MDSKLYMQQDNENSPASDYTTPTVTNLGHLYDFTLGASFVGFETAYQTSPVP